MATALTRIFNRAKRNPFATAFFALFITCLGYWFTTTLEYPEALERFELNYMEIAKLNRELKQTDSIIRLWEQTLITIVEMPEQSQFQEISKKSPGNISTQDVIYVIDAFQNSRNALNGVLLQTSILNLTDSQLKEILNQINIDASYIDTFLKERLEFMILVRTDFDRAASIKSQYETSLEGLRRFAQIEHRLNELITLHNSVSEKHNSLIRIDRKQRERQEFKSNLRIAAYVYMGGYIGAWLGFLVRHIRRSYFRRKKITDKDLQTGENTDGRNFK
jgi:hypothetical protein